MGYIEIRYSPLRVLGGLAVTSGRNTIVRPDADRFRVDRYIVERLAVPVELRLAREDAVPSLDSVLRGLSNAAGICSSSEVCDDCLVIDKGSTVDAYDVRSEVCGLRGNLETWVVLIVLSDGVKVAESLPERQKEGLVASLALMV